MPDERSPLLQFPETATSSDAPDESLGDLYAQFCHLVGIKPINHPPDQKFHAQPESLFQRATKHRRNQTATYLFSATVSNGLLLSQVVLGAALTGLGASASSHILITVFGALNTVIAGVLAFVKSRGQPMRARMFRDDLDRVVDEIENSAVMWLGISSGVHGYDAIDTDDQVTVRSEVARLTRLYDKAVKTNTMNDPDTYSAGNLIDAYSAATRSRAPGPAAAAAAAPVVPAPTQPSAAPAATDPPPPAAQQPIPVDPDASPATQAPTAKIPAPAADAGKSAPSPPAAAAAPPPPPPQSVGEKLPVPADPDESPATATHPPAAAPAPAQAPASPSPTSSVPSSSPSSSSSLQNPLLGKQKSAPEQDSTPA
nr:hypothetical protein CFP56_59637 [Quercus suber]